MDTLLSPTARTLLEAERALLQALRSLLERLETDAETVARLDELVDHLDELFLVVVVGEFNAGKSSLLNALFGEKIMEEGPIPTTAKITVLRYGPEPLVRQLSEYLVERQHPAPLLRYLHLVDTPGTNSIVRRHQEITERFIPRADLVLFVTSFDRPLSESERQFLAFIREAWGKRLVFVLNKVDLADPSGRELEQVLAYLAASCREVMGFEPRVFPVSAELAYAAKTTAAPSSRDVLWEQSRFGPLETFVTETLAGSGQLALKLAAPLDTAAKLIDAFGSRLDARRAVLREDEARLEALHTHFTRAEAGLREGYARYLAELDNLLHTMEKRGEQFLEDNIRIGKIRLLKDRDGFKEEFNRQVIRRHEYEVEERLTEAVDWLLRHVLDLWNETQSRFDAGLRARFEAPQGAFQYNRAEVFDKIRREAERRAEAYNLREEARRILENARSAVAMFLGAEGVAAGIGTVATVIIATTAVDVTGGLVAAGALAAFGFLFLPRQKRKAIREFRERVEALRGDLRAALQAQFTQEIDGALARVRELVAPFGRFIEAEQATLAAAEAERRTLRTRLDDLRTDVRTEFGADLA
jgi:small GTP-binding protein